MPAFFIKRPGHWIWNRRRKTKIWLRLYINAIKDRRRIHNYNRKTPVISYETKHNTLIKVCFYILHKKPNLTGHAATQTIILFIPAPQKKSVSSPHTLQSQTKKYLQTITISCETKHISLITVTFLFYKYKKLDRFDCIL